MVANEGSDDNYKYNSDAKENNNEDENDNTNVTETKKKCIKHYLSKSVKDENCIIDETFFPNAKTHVFENIQKQKWYLQIIEAIRVT